MFSLLSICVTVNLCFSYESGNFVTILSNLIIIFFILVFLGKKLFMNLNRTSIIYLMFTASRTWNRLCNQTRRRRRNIRSLENESSTSNRRRRRSRRVAKQEKSFTSVSAGTRNSSEKFRLCRHLLVDKRRTGNRVCCRRRQHDVVASKFCQRRRSFLFDSFDNVDVESVRSVRPNNSIQNVDSICCRRSSDSSARNDVSEFCFDFVRRSCRRNVGCCVVFFVGKLAAIIWN